jgi:protein disulfide-isomerase A1
MIKQSLPAVSFVTADNFESFSKSDKVVIIGFFAADDTTSNNTFAAVSNAQRDDFIFGATNDAALAKKEGVSIPGVVMYKDFDEGKTVNTGKFEQAPLEAWTKQAAVPLMGEVGPETYTGYMESGLPLAYLFVENDEDKKRLGDALLPVASKYRGKVNFATIDAVQFGGHASNLNLYQPSLFTANDYSKENWPAFAIQDVAKNQKFPYDQTQEITVDDIEKFVASYLDGSVLPSIKSEPIPETQEGPVTVIVAHNYKAIVLDDDKDVLLEFYAPWVNSSVPNLTYNSVWTLQDSCPEIRTIGRCLLWSFRQGRCR